MENQSNMVLANQKIAGIQDEQDFKYWSEEFGISKDELQASVDAGGSLTEAVAEYVKKMDTAA
jgi:hypothetical protein